MKNLFKRNSSTQADAGDRVLRADARTVAGINLRERQLAATLRSDGAESTAEAGTTFEPNPEGGETVLAKGKPVGQVL